MDAGTPAVPATKTLEGESIAEEVGDRTVCAVQNAAMAVAISSLLESAAELSIEAVENIHFEEDVDNRRTGHERYQLLAADDEPAMFNVTGEIQALHVIGGCDCQPQTWC